MTARRFLRYLRPLHPLPTGLAPAGRPRAPVRALLCDLYGTLFVSASGDIATPIEDPRTQEVAALMARFGIPGTPAALRRRLEEEVDRAHQRLRAAGADCPEVRIERIWQTLPELGHLARARRFALAYELIVNPVTPMPGLTDLLQTCRRTALPLGIVSNAQFFTPLLFPWFLGASPAKLGFAPDLTVYSFRLGVAKPSPALLEACLPGLRRRGLGTSEVLVLGNDMLNDIAPAQALGFQTALFAGDGRSLRQREDHPACRGLTPDLIVTHLAQVARIVDRPAPAGTPGKS